MLCLLHRGIEAPLRRRKATNPAALGLDRARCRFKRLMWPAWRNSDSLHRSPMSAWRVILRELLPTFFVSGGLHFHVVSSPLKLRLTEMGLRPKCDGAADKVAP